MPSWNLVGWIIYFLWCSAVAVLEMHYLGFGWKYWVVYLPSCWIMLILVNINTAHINKKKDEKVKGDNNA